MPRACSICGHPQRAEIESAIIARKSLRDIARQFSVSKDSLSRHRDGCVKEEIQDAQVKQVEVFAWNAITEMEWMHRQTHLIYEEARSIKDNRTSIQVLGELRKQTELFSDLLSESEQRSQDVMQQEWINLRELIFHALQPFPDARIAVARALLALEKNNDSDDNANAGQQLG